MCARARDRGRRRRRRHLEPDHLRERALERRRYHEQIAASDGADRRLAELGRVDLKGRLGTANAKLAYQQYKQVFAGERWEAVAVRGATKQRCLWASTSTKDPPYRDTIYVEELIGPETVSTMPEQTIRAFQDHGRVAAMLERGVGDARRLLAEVAAAGVDYGDVIATLERDGIENSSPPSTSS